MTARISIRQAASEDADTVVSILHEAACWLEENGMAMWRSEELEPARTRAQVAAGLFFVAECDGEVAGVVRFELEDQLFWPDIAQEESAFIHRFAARRRFAGMGVSTALLTFAVERTQLLGRRFLRLDCEALRPKLRAVYERFGFTYHSDRQVGPYFVSRYEYDVEKDRTSKA